MKFEIFDKVKSFAIRNGSKAVMITKKHSPAILLGVGVVGVVGATVMACKETLKVNDILDEAKESMDKISMARENDQFKDKYSEDDAKKDKTIVTARTTVKIVKNYIPSAMIMACSIACILASYKIMKKRTVALTAAYNGLKMTFDKYRKRVKAKYGDDEDKNLLFGIDEIQSDLEKLEKMSEEEKKAEAEKIANDKRNAPWYSDYAKFFDEASPYWDRHSEYNKAFLLHQQSIFNEKLNRIGFVMLNEVYRALGIPETQAGAIVGWLKNGNGDGFVDFGMASLENSAGRRCINGYENVWLLDFNVDGVIYDKIGAKF